jgi:hypothetical protein
LKGVPVYDLITQWEKELSIPVHCFLLKKKIIEDTRFDISLPNHEDWEFHIRIASKFPKYMYISEATAHYRIKKVAMSQDKELMKDGKNRCIANVIASQKIHQEHIPALYERLDYKIAVGIISCEKNVEKINAIRNTWARDLEKYQIPYYIVIGNPSISTCKLEGDILYVPCSDNYESLPKKVFYLYKYILDNTPYDYVYKIDDDCFLNIENLYSTYFWKYNYFGRIVATEPTDLNRTWHFGKCSDHKLNDVPYERDYIGSWCGGGFGYFLSRNALACISHMEDFVKTDLYEDKAIGDALRTNNILPEENLRYRTLDINQFKIKHHDKAEFEELIYYIDHDVFKYETIMELQKGFQFHAIYNKKMKIYAESRNANQIVEYLQ